MNNTETARLARQWAEGFLTHADKVDDRYDPSKAGVIAAAEHIMATTPPPTMADTEWDDEKHPLAGATTPSGEEVVMFWPEDDYIRTAQESWSRDCLTPNGKRYELREVTETPDVPTHPATLVTEADYENAPHGTVVSGSETLDLYVKNVDLWHRLVTPNGPTLTVSSVSMAGTPRTVLRKGWGK